MSELDYMRRRFDEFFDAIERDDLETVKHVMDDIVGPECVFTSVVASELEGGVLHGPDEIRHYFSELMQMFELRYEERRFEEPRPGILVVLVDFSARSKTSGLTLEYNSGYVFEIADGLIKTSTTFLSHREALEAAHA